ncbi:MAG: hypothetical protein JO164_11295 [Candidatus Eremiobacteraeota bacterium]|nr:hypothetical protein [Candidatus Eremiobacteraeota bacterium]
MIVRRLLAGVLLPGLAVPTLAAAPHAGPARSAPVLALPTSGNRVFARADAAYADASPSPAPSASPAASFSPAGSPFPASTPSAEVAAKARAVFDANRAGAIDRTQYTDAMNTIITAGALAQTAAQLSALGEVKRFTQVRKVTQGALTLYVFRVELAKPPAIEQAIAWGADGRVQYLSFGPAR